MEALLTVNSPPTAEPRLQRNQGQALNDQPPNAPEDPLPEEQYIPPTPPPATAKHTPQRETAAKATSHLGMKFISPTSTANQETRLAKYQKAEHILPPKTDSSQKSNQSTSSLGGVIKLWTDPNTANTPDPIFDEWKLVEKRGKRNAETSNSIESKRSDKRDTPTRMKRQAGTGMQNRAGPSHKTRPAKPVEPVPKPHAIKKKLIFHNPYRNSKKQVDHQAICANRPLTWQQRLNVPPKWGDDETMEDSSPPQHPLSPSPYSPPRKFPAEETTPRF
jgi:hypothetical protein